MNILITGGNGFVGRHLVEALHARGDSIRVLTSSNRNTEWLEERNITLFHGDIRSPETLTAPMHGVDAVVHLVAETRKWGSMQDSYVVNVIGTKNVCQAALVAGVHRLVHISTFTIYKMMVGRAVTEDDLLAPLNEPYSVTKAQGDMLVQRMIREDHLPAVILRLGALLGPGDAQNFGRLANRIRARKGIIVGVGNNAVPFVYIADVVQGLLLALDSEQAEGKIYNISNDQPFTQAQYLASIAHELGVEPPHIHVPYVPLYTAATLAERVAILSKSRIPPILTRHGIKILGEDNHLSIDKARRELGYSPHVSLREGVQLTSAWYQQNANTVERDLATLITE